MCISYSCHTLCVLSLESFFWKLSESVPLPNPRLPDAAAAEAKAKARKALSRLVSLLRSGDKGIKWCVLGWNKCGVPTKWDLSRLVSQFP